MVSLPDEVVADIVSLLDEPASYALSAMVNRQWCKGSKSASPRRLIIDLKDMACVGSSFERADGLIDWMCDKLQRGRLDGLKHMTLAIDCSIFENHEAEQRVMTIKTFMKSLPLDSCTFDSYDVLNDIYNKLPVSIREVTDKNSQEVISGCGPLRQPCFKHISTFCLSHLYLDFMHEWLDGFRPIVLQHLTVADYFDADESALCKFAEVFPVLESIDVTVYASRHIEAVLDHHLQLPKLRRACFRFTPDKPSQHNNLSRIVLTIPETMKYVKLVPFVGLKVGRLI